MLSIAANLHTICTKTIEVFRRDRDRLSRRLTRTRHYLEASTSTGIRNHTKELKTLHDAHTLEMDYLNIILTCLQIVQNNRHELVSRGTLPAALREPVATLAWISYTDPRLKSVRIFLLETVMFYHADVERKGIKDIAMRRCDAFVDRYIVTGKHDDIPSPPTGSDDDEPPSPPSDLVIPSVPRDCPGAPMKKKFSLIR